MEGRSLFLFTIPIVMASMLLFPTGKFYFCQSQQRDRYRSRRYRSGLTQCSCHIGFFLVALASWLSARSLEQTLQELRNINANLDHVVHERTQALAEFLERERIEAGTQPGHSELHRRWCDRLRPAVERYPGQPGRTGNVGNSHRADYR